MAKVIIIERADGGTGVVHLTPDFLAKHGGDENAALNAIKSKVVPDDAISSEIVEQTALPNRVFRDAWQKSGSTIVEDMPKARVIHMDRIKIVRDAKLLEENENLEAAIDAGDTTEEAAVRSRRQTLRDTGAEVAAIAAAANTTVLDAIWPTAELGVRV